MSVIEFNFEGKKYTKESTVNDVMKVYKSLSEAQRGIDEGRMDITIMADYTLLEDLFGEQGLTKNELLEAPSADYTKIAAQLEEIVKVIMGGEEDDDEKTPKKSRKSRTSKKGSTEANN